MIALWTLLGLLIGSFLNVVIHRFPKMLERSWHQECRMLLDLEAPITESSPYNICHPRSACPSCGQTLSAWHNIPLLSYLYLRGRCARCAAPISWRYPLVEALTALGFLAIALQGHAWQPALMLALAWCLLICMFFIDLDTQLLPDQLSLALLWLGLIYHSITHNLPLQDAVWGAVLGYGILWSIYWVFKIITGKEGMGFGDFKLLAALGAWLGWQNLPLILLGSSVLGTLSALLLLRTRQAIAFGPYLIMAGLIAWQWGDALIRWYWHV